MKSIAKSLLLAVAGTGVFFFFLMMAVIPTMALFARTSGNVAQKSVVINPSVLLRTWGLPLAGVAFVVLFALAMYRFRRIEQQALAARH